MNRVKDTSTVDLFSITIRVITHSEEIINNRIISNWEETTEEMKDWEVRSAAGLEPGQDEVVRM